ncbi:MAG: hypothetical protein IKU12_02945, partial [Oscillospiraceae bacterium]|nr:hypothetical protein [Oscillospiraceae bacterium]
MAITCPLYFSGGLQADPAPDRILFSLFHSIKPMLVWQAERTLCSCAKRPFPLNHKAAETIGVAA